LRLPIKVIPGASQDEISGWLGDRLKVRVRAPAESGKANKAVCRLLANRLGIAPSSVQIVSGGASPLKMVSLDGIDSRRLRMTLGR